MNVDLCIGECAEHARGVAWRILNARTNDRHLRHTLVNLECARTNLGANQQRRIGGNQTGQKSGTSYIVGGVNGIEPFNSDLRQSNYSASTASGVAKSNASCNACSARGASDSLTMQVMRISEVEIIWMLIFASASVPNMRAA